jgi:hypothetical protein
LWLKNSIAITGKLSIPPLENFVSSFTKINQKKETKSSRISTILKEIPPESKK